MSNPIDRFFASLGEPMHPSAPSPDCPSDEAFAGYLDPMFPAKERDALEMHALACADCHDLLRMVIDVTAVDAHIHGQSAPVFGQASRPASLRIIGRLMQRGIELLNQAELTVKSLVDGPLTPAPIGVRGAAAPAAEWVSIRGPGSGLDALELQVQTNGTARLVVRCDDMPTLAPGELTSILLDVDGSTREKRPFAGESISFAPIGRGQYRVRLVARVPSGPERLLAEATLDLSA